MNDKGFTIIELLAVLVVLVMILMIAIPSITSSVERNKDTLNQKKIEVIESSAQEYVSKYKNKISNYSGFISGSCCIELEDIKNIGLLSENELLDTDKGKISGYVCYDSTNKKYSYTETEKTSCGVDSNE